MSGNLLDPQHDQNPWRRKHDDPGQPAIVPSPKSRYYPSSLKGLLRIIMVAERSPDPKPEVRACGSHWSLSDRALTPDFIVETNDPDEAQRPRLDPAVPFYNVIPGCMTAEAIDWFNAQGMPAFDSNLVQVRETVQNLGGHAARRKGRRAQRSASAWSWSNFPLTTDVGVG